MPGSGAVTSIVATRPDRQSPTSLLTDGDTVVDVSTIPFCDDVLDSSVPVLQLVDVAKQLDLVITRVHQLLHDRRLLAVKRDGVLGVPEAFFDDTGAVLKGLPGLIAVLHDGGFGDKEILEWMFRPDPTLAGGSPIAAMRTHSAREVMRRAQALAF